MKNLILFLTLVISVTQSTSWQNKKRAVYKPVPIIITSGCDHPVVEKYPNDLRAFSSVKSNQPDYSSWSFDRFLKNYPAKQFSDEQEDFPRPLPYKASVSSSFRPNEEPTYLPYALFHMPKGHKESHNHHSNKHPKNAFHHAKQTFSPKVPDNEDYNLNYPEEEPEPLYFYSYENGPSSHNFNHKNKPSSGLLRGQQATYTFKTNGFPVVNEYGFDDLTEGFKSHNTYGSDNAKYFTPYNDENKADFREQNTEREPRNTRYSKDYGNYYNNYPSYSTIVKPFQILNYYNKYLNNNNKPYQNFENGNFLQYHPEYRVPGEAEFQPSNFEALNGFVNKDENRAPSKFELHDIDVKVVPKNHTTKNSRDEMSEPTFENLINTEFFPENDIKDQNAPYASEETFQTYFKEPETHKVFPHNVPVMNHYPDVLHEHYFYPKKYDINPLGLNELRSEKSNKQNVPKSSQKEKYQLDVHINEYTNQKPRHLKKMFSPKVKESEPLRLVSKMIKPTSFLDLNDEDEKVKHNQPINTYIKAFNVYEKRKDRFPDVDDGYRSQYGTKPRFPVVDTFPATNNHNNEYRPFESNMPLPQAMTKLQYDSQKPDTSNPFAEKEKNLIVQNFNPFNTDFFTENRVPNKSSFKNNLPLKTYKFPARTESFDDKTIDEVQKDYPFEFNKFVAVNDNQDSSKYFKPSEKFPQDNKADNHLFEHFENKYTKNNDKNKKSDVPKHYHNSPTKLLKPFGGLFVDTDYFDTNPDMLSIHSKGSKHSIHRDSKSTPNRDDKHFRDKKSHRFPKEDFFQREESPELVEYPVNENMIGHDFTKDKNKNRATKPLYETKSFYYSQNNYPFELNPIPSENYFEFQNEINNKPKPNQTPYKSHLLPVLDNYFSDSENTKPKKYHTEGAFPYKTTKVSVVNYFPDFAYPNTKDVMNQYEYNFPAESYGKGKANKVHNYPHENHFFPTSESYEKSYPKTDYFLATYGFPSVRHHKHETPKQFDEGDNFLNFQFNKDFDNLNEYPKYDDVDRFPNQPYQGLGSIRTSEDKEENDNYPNNAKHGKHEPQSGYSSNTQLKGYGMDNFLEKLGQLFNSKCASNIMESLQKLNVNVRASFKEKPKSKSKESRRSPDRDRFGPNYTPFY